MRFDMKLCKKVCTQRRWRHIAWRAATSEASSSFQHCRGLSRLIGGSTLCPTTMSALLPTVVSFALVTTAGQEVGNKPGVRVKVCVRFAAQEIYRLALFLNPSNCPPHLLSRTLGADLDILQLERRKLMAQCGRGHRGKNTDPDALRNTVR